MVLGVVNDNDSVQDQIFSVVTDMNVFLHVCNCRTYGTALVTVSLKATFGFPITHGQLYSLSILYDTHTHMFLRHVFTPRSHDVYEVLSAVPASRSPDAALPCRR